MQLRLRTLAMATAGLGAAGLAGCGSPPTPTAVPSAVLATRLPGVGRVLVDGNGFTLYVYVPDERGRSRCTSVCAEQWPPLLVPRGELHPVAGAGLRASLLGTTPRPGGALQVTYNGWPLYTYLDDARGQVNGQGEGMGAWYVLSVNGTVDRLPATG